jgi:hypothetical protein
MSNRGIVELTLNGEVFELHPTFENLDKLETVLNKGAVGFLQNDLSSGMFKTGDVVSIIQVCAIPPRGAKRPSWWNREGIGRAVLHEGLLNCTRVVVEFLTKALTAGSETDIKTVGADEDDEKK